MHIALTTDPELPVPPRLYGGIERVVDLLVRGLVERGHEVTLFAHPDSDVPCRFIPYGGSSQRPLDVLRNTLSVSRLVFRQPDIVHSFGRLAYLAVLLPTRIPTIMSYQRKPSQGRVQLAARLARNGSLAFTGCSEHIAAQIRPHAPAFPVFNGVPLETYDFKPDVADDAPLVFLGRLAPIKGVHTAVEVAQQTGHRLVLAGNVPEARQTYFDEQVQPHLDGERIRYVGPVDDAEKNDLLGRAAAFLMPIAWEEPFGIVMAEALACGTPVIGTRRGAVPEVVDDGVTGFVCDTTEEMAAAVEQLNDIDRTACRKRCERLFSGEAIVDAYEQLYERHASGALS